MLHARTKGAQIDEHRPVNQAPPPEIRIGYLDGAGLRAVNNSDGNGLTSPAPGFCPVFQAECGFSSHTAGI
jgi:hypothetical protein